MALILRFVLGIVWILATSPAFARVHAPRVVSPYNADAYSMRTFGEFDRWHDLVTDKRAWAMYEYLVDPRSGVFHMSEVREGYDTLSEYTTVRDPVKIINVYGYGYCGIFGPFMAGVCEGVGLGPARTLVLSDWQHVAAEVQYADQWHYVDVDVRAVFRRSDGKLASFAAARSDPSLWLGRGPYFFPNDDLEATQRIYESTPYYYHYGYYQSGHTMDYVLRQGESFKRWWQPQGGRWHHLPMYHQSEFMRQLMETAPRGPAPNHRDFSVHNYGNGRFLYRPNLTAESTDFDDGVYDSKNVIVGSEGLICEGQGGGYATFEVRTPYIIVPQVNRLETTDDDIEASVVEINAAGIRLSLSLDGGHTWRPLRNGSRSGRYDLTEHVAGTYGYLLRINFDDTASLVRSLQITTWVQVAPASLPSLRGGRNEMAFRWNDHYGLPSRVLAVCSDTSKPNELKPLVLDLPDDYDPRRTAERIRGPLVAKIVAPPGTRIAWFTAEGSFRTHQGERARETRNTMAYAVNAPRDWQPIYRAEMPVDMEHWHYNAAREVKLETLVRQIYVRYVGDPAVNNFRVFAHCIDERPRPMSSVRITHKWRDQQGQQSRQIELKGPGKYRIEAGADPVDESLEIAVSSDHAPEHEESAFATRNEAD